MAQKASPLTLRLNTNRSADSYWFDSLNPQRALLADALSRKLIQHLLHPSFSDYSLIFRIASSFSQNNSSFHCFFHNPLLSLPNQETPQGLSDHLTVTALSPQSKSFPRKSLLTLKSSSLQRLYAVSLMNKKSSFGIPFHKRNLFITGTSLSFPFQSAHLSARWIAYLLAQGLNLKKTLRLFQNSFPSLPYNNNFSSVQGFRVRCKGPTRIGQQAVTETIESGRLARGKLDQCLDYHCLSAQTDLGLVGIKVWISYEFPH